MCIFLRFYLNNFIHNIGIICYINAQLKTVLIYTDHRQKNEDKYFTFTIFISILSIANRHTSHTSISIFIRIVVVSNYTRACRCLPFKNNNKNKILKCHFPQITKDIQEKKKKR